MKKVILGELMNGHPFILPADAATQTFAFIARKGAGKTYAAGKLVELLLTAAIQCVILDTVGNWYGLRLAADGSGKSEFDIPVLGGLRGDIPLEATGGALVADLVVDTGRSVIIDVSQFSQGERKRFAAAFGVQLWKRKKADREPSPLHLVIEESQLIIPQNVRSEDAAMVGVFEEIVRLGRNYGIGVSMISQRPQSVNKEVLTQTECLVVLQVNGAQERKALREWIVHQGMDAKLLDELPSLKVGTAYIWSPQWLGVLEKVAIGRKVTLDASATPKAGSRGGKRELAPLDLDALREKMAAVIERAKADDPKELRALLTELRREAQQHESKVAGLERDHEEELRQMTERVRGAWAALLSDARMVLDAINDAGEKAASLKATLESPDFSLLLNVRARRAQTPTIAPSHVTGTTVIKQTSRAYTVPRRPATGESTVSGGEKAILICCAQNGHCSPEQLTVLTGYKRSSRDAYVQRLASKGYVERVVGEVNITDAGIAALGGDYEPLPTGAALRQFWLDKLGGGERVLLSLIIAAYPHAISRDTLSQNSQYKRSSRDTYLQRLMSRRLIADAGRGSVIATDNLF